MTSVVDICYFCMPSMQLFILRTVAGFFFLGPYGTATLHTRGLGKADHTPHLPPGRHSIQPWPIGGSHCGLCPDRHLPQSEPIGVTPEACRNPWQRAVPCVGMAKLGERKPAALVRISPPHKHSPQEESRAMKGERFIPELGKD